MRISATSLLELEPVCCKKQQIKVPDQLLVCGIGDLWRTWMIPNWLYMSPSDSLDHPGSILYHSAGIFRGPLFHKPVTGQELFFAVSYSKPALVKYQVFKNFKENYLSIMYFFFFQVSWKRRFGTYCLWSYSCLHLVSLPLKLPLNSYGIQTRTTLTDGNVFSCLILELFLLIMLLLLP